MGNCIFIFMSFAALSTVIAVFENILSMTMEVFGWNRKKAVLRNIVGVIILSLPAVLGYNVLSGSSRLALVLPLWIWRIFLFLTISCRWAAYYLFCSARRKRLGMGQFLGGSKYRGRHQISGIYKIICPFRCSAVDRCYLCEGIL